MIRKGIFDRALQCKSYRLTVFIKAQVADKLFVHRLVSSGLQVALQLDYRPFQEPVFFRWTAGENVLQDWQGNFRNFSNTYTFTRIGMIPTSNHDR